MLGEEITEINGDIKDAVGELIKMVSGVARKKLEAEGLNVNAVIPALVSGSKHSIVHVLGGENIIIPFELDQGLLLSISVFVAQLKAV